MKASKIVLCSALCVASGAVAIGARASSSLYGVWQAAPVKGSGWNKAYQFFPNGRFVWHKNQMDCEAREVARSGTWHVSGQKLVLRVAKHTILTGGHLEDATGSCASGQELVDAHPRTEALRRTQSLSVGTAQKDPKNGRVALRIGGVNFWKFADDPNGYNG